MAKTAMVPVPSLVLPPMQTIKLGGFHLTSRGVDVHGRPSFREFQGAFEFSRSANERSGLWLADLICYADTRSDWDDLISALIDSERLTEGSVRTYRSVGKRVPKERRVEGMGIGHTAEVASLPAEEQTAWLVRARDEQLSERELRHAIKSKKRVNVLKGQASDVAAALALVGDTAWLAKCACEQIPQSECRQAEAKIAEARTLLDRCAAHLVTLRALTGQQTKAEGR